MANGIIVLFNYPVKWLKFCTCSIIPTDSLTIWKLDEKIRHCPLNDCNVIGVVLLSGKFVLVHSIPSAKTRRLLVLLETDLFHKTVCCCLCFHQSLFAFRRDNLFGRNGRQTVSICVTTTVRPKFEWVMITLNLMCIEWLISHSTIVSIGKMIQQALGYSSIFICLTAPSPVYAYL